MKYCVLLIALLFSFFTKSQVSFVHDYDNECLPVTVNFTNTSSVGNYYEWRVNGETFVTKDLSYEFKDIASSSLYLYAYDTSGSNKFELGFDFEFLELNFPYINKYPAEVCSNQQVDLDIWVEKMLGYPIWYFGENKEITRVGRSVNKFRIDTVGYYPFEVHLSSEECGSYVITDSINVLEELDFVKNRYDLYYIPSVCPGEEARISFSTRNNDELDSIEYEFGDGTGAKFMAKERYNSVTHIYQDTGIYHIKVRLISKCGNDTILEDFVEVTEEAEIEGSFDSKLVYNTFCVDEEIELEFNSKDEYVYEWEFENGQRSTERSPIISFEKSGMNVVKVHVTNTCGTTKTFSQEISVSSVIYPQAITILSSDSVCIGEHAELTASTLQRQHTKFNWKTLNIDTTVNSYVRVYDKYEQLGNYPVELTITSTCGSYKRTIKDSIYVVENYDFDLDEISLQLYGEHEACLGDTINLLFAFNKQSTLPSSIVYFGEGDSTIVNNYEELKYGDEITYVANINHAYSSNGIYNLSYRVTDFCGNTHEDTLAEFVNITESTNLIFEYFEYIDYNFDEIIEVGEEVLFLPYLNISTNWDFGDGTSHRSNKFFTKHTYNNAGVYPVSCTVENACGEKITVTEEVEVVGFSSVSEIGTFTSRIYPNPAKEELTISMDEIIEAELKIYSLQGILVKEKMVRSEEKVSLDTLSKGMYLLRLESDDKYSTHRLIIE